MRQSRRSRRGRRRQRLNPHALARILASARRGVGGRHAERYGLRAQPAPGRAGARVGGGKWRQAHSALALAPMAGGASDPGGGGGAGWSTRREDRVVSCKCCRRRRTHARRVFGPLCQPPRTHTRSVVHWFSQLLDAGTHGGLQVKVRSFCLLPCRRPAKTRRRGRRADGHIDEHALRATHCEKMGQIQQQQVVCVCAVCSRWVEATRRCLPGAQAPHCSSTLAPRPPARSFPLFPPLGFRLHTLPPTAPCLAGLFARHPPPPRVKGCRGQQHGRSARSSEAPPVPLPGSAPSRRSGAAKRSGVYIWPTLTMAGRRSRRPRPSSTPGAPASSPRGSRTCSAMPEPQVTPCASAQPALLPACPFEAGRPFLSTFFRP